MANNRTAYQLIANAYIVPTASLIDEVADGLGHTEAAQKFKMVRELIRDAVRVGKAAECDYVGPPRRGDGHPVRP